MRGTTPAAIALLLALLLPEAAMAAGAPEGEGISVTGLLVLAAAVLAPLALGAGLLALCFHSHRCGLDRAVHEEERRRFPDMVH
ncbi:MAG TPA: hypothetical protein VEB20_24970 [Azospirillaceae bacterium]|nr:hypothetical protein [Azospirillaceae bacterium]